jgi:hypothetical protein
MLTFGLLFFPAKQNIHNVLRSIVAYLNLNQHCHETDRVQCNESMEFVTSIVHFDL